MAHRPSASTPNVTCVASRILRLSCRSASDPPSGPNNRIGPNASAVSIPRATPLPVSWSTSQAAATICIHVPVTEIACPMKKRRKFGECPSEWNVRWTVTRTGVMTAPRQVHRTVRR